MFRTPFTGTPAPRSIGLAGTHYLLKFEETYQILVGRDFCEMVLDLGVPAPPSLITIFGLVAVLGNLSVLHHLEDIGLTDSPELDAVIVHTAQQEKVPGVLGLDMVPHEIAVGIEAT